MDQGMVPQDADVCVETSSWKMDLNEDALNGDGLVENLSRTPEWKGAAIIPERITRKEVRGVAVEDIHSAVDQDPRPAESAMTVASFVEIKFVPEHVAVKRYSGRTHYQAILKHVLTPEEVDRVFKVNTHRSRARLKSVPDWPYLSNLRLCDARHDHVQNLIAAATARGYSSQTVTHIRNVVSSIFSHAKKERYFSGDNPASRVTLPGMTRKIAHTLNLAQTKAVLQVMRYPEREMTLIAILTNMNVAEICGLQWKCVNLSSSESRRNGEVIPAHSIAVRKQWYRGELGTVKDGRIRFLPIPALLFTTLARLSRRAGFIGPEDYVLVSQAGTPINETNIAARRLKAIGREMQMPWLSWRVFRRLHDSLLTRD